MRAVPALAALIALTTACGGSTPTSPSLPPSQFGGSNLSLLSRGFLRATVDGTPWESAIAGGYVSNSFAWVPPLMTLTAVSAASRLSFSISGPAIDGAHGSSGPNYVEFSLYESLGASWSVSPFSSGGSGTLTITRATATRVTGTFSFTALARTQGLTPATRTVTDGTFDLSQ